MSTYVCSDWRYSKAVEGTLCCWLSSQQCQLLSFTSSDPREFNFCLVFRSLCPVFVSLFLLYFRPILAWKVHHTRNWRAIFSLASSFSSPLFPSVLSLRTWKSFFFSLSYFVHTSTLNNQIVFFSIQIRIGKLAIKFTRLHYFCFITPLLFFSPSATFARSERVVLRGHFILMRLSELLLLYPGPPRSRVSFIFIFVFTRSPPSLPRLFCRTSSV